jgi:hypothetical protein
VFASSAVDRVFIGGVIVSVFALSAVDHVFIGGVIVSVLASSAVDRVFISGVIVSVLASSAVDRVFIGGVVVSVIAWRLSSLCSFSLMLRATRRSNKYQFYSLWFDPIGARTHDLLQSRRIR